ncbi:hypothetical protein [Glycomyces sp. NPDC047010]|uniref:hypothetical protein n=1 Tax=Glycomyces sp. NPDC047010 TaxID=3155023 RepID=UPI003406C2CC
MRFAMLLAAAGEWARALAGPLVLLTAGAGLLWLSWRVGIDRLWPVALLGALGLGLGLGGIALVIAAHPRRQAAKRRRDGEAEPL